MLRPYKCYIGEIWVLVVGFILRLRCGSYRGFFAAAWANIFVFAEWHFDRRKQCFFVRAEALGVCDVADVGAELAIGPQEIADGGEQFLYLIVLFDQVCDVAGGARRGDIVERLRGLRIEAHARHVLRKHGHERQAEALIEIRDELIARHFFELAVVGGARLVRQMPVHVVRIPPAVLLALPEQARLTDAANFITPRSDALGAILAHQFAQGVDEFGLGVVQKFVVRSDAKHCGSGIGVRGSAEVSVGWSDRAADAGQSAGSVDAFNCGIQVHTPSRHDSFPYPARRPIRAALAFGARSVCAGGAPRPAWPSLAENPLEEIPRYRAANW